MKCPYCGNEDTKVIDSRPFSDGNSIKEEENVIIVTTDSIQLKRFLNYLYK